ncbi:MAG TPA: hypothetical protein VJ914_18635 [Pseudonocardiaceae bacterium]|nr:hypothetical protein [Pseudonocardiaceae bacterium]
MALRDMPDWDDGQFPETDELRVPLTTWTDPAAPVDGSERHIVRSID